MARLVTLVNTLKQHDLIDEYRLMVFPIVLGNGVRLFDDVADAVALKLVDAHPPGNGAVILTYHRAQP
jgi:dihydrofolate reductase